MPREPYSYAAATSAAPLPAVAISVGRARGRFARTETARVKADGWWLSAPFVDPDAFAL
jgi:hypothetical protein